MKNFLCRVCIFCLILCGILVSCRISKFAKKPVKTHTVDLVGDSIISDHIFIPITINDSVYRFLFDTGANVNVIDSGLAQKIGLSAEGTVIKEISNYSGRLYC